MKTPSVVAPTNVNLLDGSYEVYAYGIRKDAKYVPFYTWTEANGQDDIKERSGQKISSSTWKVTIPLNEHNSETGTYITHIYTTNNLGLKTGIGFKTVVAN